MVSAIPNISIGYSLPQSGKMSFPVDPSSLIYSHFKHISGVPAPEGTDGISITRLNILDVLIGQLNQIKRGGVALNMGNSESQIDALIESYKKQIEQARAASQAMPYVKSPSAESGALFAIKV